LGDQWSRSQWSRGAQASFGCVAHLPQVDVAEVGGLLTGRAAARPGASHPCCPPAWWSSQPSSRTRRQPRVRGLAPFTSARRSSKGSWDGSSNYWRMRQITLVTRSSRFKFLSSVTPVTPNRPNGSTRCSPNWQQPWPSTEVGDRGWWSNAHEGRCGTSAMPEWPRWWRAGMAPRRCVRSIVCSRWRAT